MTLPQIIYCQDCHKEGRQTPARWAMPDPRNSRKADFYCDNCAGTDIDQCETIEAWRKMVADPPAAPKPEPAEPTVVCRCGKAFGHRGRCKGKQTPRSRVIDKTTAYTEKKAPVPKSNGNGHIELGAFRARVITLDEYREAGCREKLSELDPVVAHVRAMKAGTVTLLDAPKGKNLKWFRERLGRALQKAHKLPVRIEMRKTDNAIAVIRSAQ